MKPRQSRPKEVERVALDLGFEFKNQEGSHRHYFRAHDRRKLTIPFHSGDVPTGTLRSIVTKGLGITVEEFNDRD